MGGTGFQPEPDLSTLTVASPIGMKVHQMNQTQILPDRPLQNTDRRRNRRGMTIVEIVAVIGIIIVLVGILLPVLSIAGGNARWASSQSNVKQIFQLMQEYTVDNRETIVPACFDYSVNSYPGKVRSLDPPGSAMPLNTPLGQTQGYGTWSDLLWTYGELGPAGGAGLLPAGASANYGYSYDSPDRRFYESEEVARSDIFRSTVNMSKTPNGTEALPFGTGATMTEAGHPGYFAANLLFDARPEEGPSGEYVNQFGRWRTSAEIKHSDQTMYLVDSWHGEVIEPTAFGFGSPSPSFGTGQSFEGQVDFRYPGNTCLMLFMDGHIGTENSWDDFTDLRSIRNIRVSDL